MEEKKYGLFTAITMIAGIVIGSGIFFKSDNILYWTNGNVIQGVFAFLIAATAIVFGSLAISQLATLTDKPGGIITYAEEFCTMPVGCAFGWFHSFAYLPSLNAVVAYVAGVYCCTLFSIDSTLENQTLIGFLFVAVLYLCNALSAKLGGYIQNGATVIKLIPLFFIAIAGLIKGNPAESIAFHTTGTGTSGLMSAIIPIIFSFDGWSVSTSICHEIKNSKKNLPLALVFSPILILIVYILYFVGISALVGPENVIAMGDSHVNFAANLLLGPIGAKVLLIFIIISVLGTVNGLTLGAIRLPYALGLRNMVPGSKMLKKESEALNGMPLNSALISFLFTSFWLLMHYVTQKFNILPHSDVSEICIVANYLGYIILYVAVIRLARKGTVKGIFNGYVFPGLAIFGALLILFGGMQNPFFSIYMAICILIILAALLYVRKNKDSIL